MAHSTARAAVLGPAAGLSVVAVSAAGRKTQRVPVCGRGWEENVTMEQRSLSRVVSLCGSSREQWRIGALANDARPGEFSTDEFERY